MTSKLQTLMWVVFLVTLGEALKPGLSQACPTSYYSALMQLLPCRQAVGPFSPLPPSEACCVVVKSLGQPCLCSIINGPPISGVDRSMAMLLPAKCAANFGPCTPEA
ncbi:hypothetical protein H6P81_010642 [Aristolochia fimbriata]|uniref:Bifunctional inhibitor/plant lipid transfer protein/seed storage helical domain-containing protein n=1 Tax=Aristolochia fimbriata TaxID=158543 RepID=A0AAV7ESN9_ARIFI|nr:hypothetical protein H6P81_010642 [Aristolochia fimbriata]